MLGIGIYALVEGSSLIRLIRESYADELINITLFTTAMSIFIGVTVCLIGWTFYGFFSTYHESKCMLGPYVIMMLVMFLFMLVGAILCFVQSMDQLQFALEGTMKNYKGNCSEIGQTNSSISENGQMNISISQNCQMNSSISENGQMNSVDVDIQMNITNVWDDVQESVS